MQHQRRIARQRIAITAAARRADPHPVAGGEPDVLLLGQMRRIESGQSDDSGFDLLSLREAQDLLLQAKAVNRPALVGSKKVA